VTDTVTVRIETQARTTYARFVEMPRAEYERIVRDLESLPGRQQQKLEEDLHGRYINGANDWQDEDSVEVTEFRLAPEAE